MDEISFKGEKYLKASVIAEKFGYTSDYIGQLCRGDMVKATLVGRSWYVNEESLRDHKKARYRSNLAKSKESIKKIASERSYMTGNPRYLSRVMNYEEDFANLLPEITKEKIAETVVEVDEKNTIVKSIDFKLEKPQNSSLDENYKIHHSLLPLSSLPRVRIVSTPSRRPSDVYDQVNLDVVARKPASHTIKLKRSYNTLIFTLLAILIGGGLFVSIASLERFLVMSEDGLVRYGYDVNFDVLKVVNLDLD